MLYASERSCFFLSENALFYRAVNYRFGDINFTSILAIIAESAIFVIFYLVSNCSNSRTKQN